MVIKQLKREHFLTTPFIVKLKDLNLEKQNETYNCGLINYQICFVIII